MTRRSKIIYWTSTVLLALGMFSGGLAQLFRAQETADGFTHLGYPLYLLSILGVWKILGVVALLIPGFPLLKEWAYAGFFFAMTGAIISHMASADSFAELLAPFIFLLLSVVSWYFRPESRKFFIKQFEDK